MAPCSLDTLLGISDELNCPSNNCQFRKKAARHKCARSSMLYCDRVSVSISISIKMRLRRLELGLPEARLERAQEQMPRFQTGC